MCHLSSVPLSGQQRIKALKKLIKKNNPHAFISMANAYESRSDVIQSNTKSLEMYIRSAELGNANAYHDIGYFHHQGILVEQDRSKALEFYQVAAKKGSLEAHQYLALIYQRNGDIQTSIEHLKVIANAGDQESMDKLMKHYKDKFLLKEDLTQTLRAFQASSNEMKSNDRVNARLIEESRRKGVAPPAHLLK